MSPEDFARRYPGDGLNLNAADVAARAKEWGITPQQATVEALRQGRTSRTTSRKARRPSLLGHNRYLTTSRPPCARAALRRSCLLPLMSGRSLSRNVKTLFRVGRRGRVSRPIRYSLRALDFFGRVLRLASSVEHS